MACIEHCLLSDRNQALLAETALEYVVNFTMEVLSSGRKSSLRKALENKPLSQFGNPFLIYSAWLYDPAYLGTEPPQERLLAPHLPKPPPKLQSKNPFAATKATEQPPQPPTPARPRSGIEEMEKCRLVRLIPSPAFTYERDPQGWDTLNGDYITTTGMRACLLHCVLTFTTVSHFKVVECGGGGYCGALSAIVGLLSVTNKASLEVPQLVTHKTAPPEKPVRGCPTLLFL